MADEDPSPLQQLIRTPAQRELFGREEAYDEEMAKQRPRPVMRPDFMEGTHSQALNEAINTPEMQAMLAEEHRRMEEENRAASGLPPMPRLPSVRDVAKNALAPRYSEELPADTE